MPVQTYYTLVAETLAQLPVEPVEQIIAILREARLKRKRIFFFGNGGSSSTASHIVNDILKSTARPDLPRFAVICLSDNVPTLTAYANDVGYERIFAEPLAALAQAGDIAIALSGSGNSRNVLEAMDVAEKMGLVRIGLTGQGGGQLKNKCDTCVVVPSESMQVIEDAHLVMLHSVFLALCNDKAASA